MYDPELAKEIDAGRILFVKRDTPEFVHYAFFLRLQDRTLTCLDALAALRRTRPYLKRLAEPARIIVDEFADLWASVERGPEDLTPEVQARWDAAWARWQEYRRSSHG